MRKAGGYAKFWIESVESVELESSKGMKTKDLSRAEELVINNMDKIIEKWHDVFSN